MSRSSSEQLEAQRLSELNSFHLDCTSSEEFDELTRLASRIFNVPIALVSLVDKDRQFFKSKVGLNVSETPRNVSFCAHAIAPNAEGTLYVPDTSVDPRFSANKLVTGPPFIRSYMGSPLISSSGHKLGTLCVIDTEPRRDFETAEKSLLEDMARLVSSRLELSRLNSFTTENMQKWSRFAEKSFDAILCVNEKGTVTYSNFSASKMCNRSPRPYSQIALFLLELGVVLDV